MGRVRPTAVNATFSILESTLDLQEEYSSTLSSTLYIVRVDMAGNSLSMEFCPDEYIPLPEMRARCLRAILDNLVAIHDATCSCINQIEKGLISPSGYEYH